VNIKETQISRLRSRPLSLQMRARGKVDPKDIRRDTAHWGAKCTLGGPRKKINSSITTNRVFRGEVTGEWY